ncbi:MAG TPA: GntR family transcriptional regulator [Candidatus Butyricicoccus stercorigallinarum]|nr:GntR family transcriptional regulator [Candidatus Butyricicoccus stercorigallinarum]
MVIDIDFNSDEAIYVQLRNQIVVGIATAQLSVGDSLPSVRQLADLIGINMHTVNKAYSVLKQEGFIKLDRRKGAVVAIDYDKCIASEQLSRMLRVLLAEAMCRRISREEVHDMVDDVFDSFGVCPMEQQD